MLRSDPHMIVDVARRVAIAAGSGCLIFKVTVHHVGLGFITTVLAFICATPLCLAPSNRGIADWWRDSLRELLWVGRMLKNAPLLVVLFMLGFCSVCYSAYLLGLDANRSAILSMLISVVCYGGITVYIITNAQEAAFAAYMAESGKKRLSSKAVQAIVKSIHEEPFIANEKLGHQDVEVLGAMLKARKGSRDDATQTQSKESLVDELRRIRKVQDTCCICLCPFEEGEGIKVLPKCHHEIHSCCFQDWSATFGGSKKKKWGCPTCPYCRIEIKPARARSSNTKVKHD